MPMYIATVIISQDSVLFPAMPHPLVFPPGPWRPNFSNPFIPCAVLIPRGGLKRVGSFAVCPEVAASRNHRWLFPGYSWYQQVHKLRAPKSHTKHDHLQESCKRKISKFWSARMDIAMCSSSCWFVGGFRPGYVVGLHRSNKHCPATGLRFA